ncbi:MAG: putative TonB-dependent receptor, partial [Verrucomicrobiales bacterium]|nr:putative TonB-dependent receptor [Verrucomicrobiales bacterium]
RNSSRMNLLISFTVHALIVLVGFYFAARGGLLGKQLKKIAVEMVKEKPPEKPKEPEKPKVEVPKPETPKEMPKVEVPKMVEAQKLSAPPPSAPPTVAPPAAELPSFDFAGGKAVQSSADPIDLYKGLVQFAFTAKWNKPEDLEDDKFAAEIQVSISRDGRISNPQWLKSSGNTRWDNSVKQALAAVTSMDHMPPTNFPPHVIIRFDVQEQTESAFQ